MRVDPAPVGAELQMLGQYLDYQRATVLLKTDGLNREQMARVLPTSSLTLAGLLNHLALVENTWMHDRFLGLQPLDPWNGVDWNADPDWDLRTAVGHDPEQLRERYREACHRSRQATARAAGPEQLSAQARRDGRHFSLRWVLLHLIEETARHAGHADLLREAIDGTTGE